MMRFVKPFCSPCELLTTIMETSWSKKYIYTMMSLQNPFCIPLWAFNNNLYKQIQTKDEKDIVMRLQSLCELLITNLHEQISEKWQRYDDLFIVYIGISNKLNFLQMLSWFQALQTHTSSCKISKSSNAWIAMPKLKFIRYMQYWFLNKL
jgi:hypothetical protein